MPGEMDNPCPRAPSPLYLTYRSLYCHPLLVITSSPHITYHLFGFRRCYSGL
ncbi:MAG: hypothetical protein GF311_28000 [Candidatus Lokiarchaeota archaeon]|nr:hypothetical protein [Candidatus Lokiarchaeota archaeon]